MIFRGDWHPSVFRVEETLLHVTRRKQVRNVFMCEDVSSLSSISFSMWGGGGGKRLQEGAANLKRNIMPKPFSQGLPLKGPHVGLHVCAVRRARRVYKGLLVLQWSQNVTVNVEEKRSQLLRPSTVAVTVEEVPDGRRGRGRRKWAAVI